MQEEAIVLKCIAKETLPEDTDIYQTEDGLLTSRNRKWVLGTVFYLDNSSPVRLYVQWK